MVRSGSFELSMISRPIYFQNLDKNSPKLHFKNLSNADSKDGRDYSLSQIFSFLFVIKTTCRSKHVVWQ